VIEDLFTPTHLLVLFVIVFFLFGAKRLPDLGKSLGHGIREFRSGIAGLSDGEPEALEQPLETPAVTAVTDAPSEPAAPAAATTGEAATSGEGDAATGEAATSGEGDAAMTGDGGAAESPADEVVDPSDVTIVDEPVDGAPIEADEATLVDDETATASVADERAAS
jgi:sec-independent protein translocase protein TatA